MTNSLTQEKALIVITGASSGIGAAMAKAFHAKGHPLLLLARRLEPMQALELNNTLCMSVDVTDATSIKEAIATAEEQYGKVGALINNAGTMLLGQVDVQEPMEWTRMLNINVMGVLNGIHAVLADMKARNTGTIINISSIAGFKTFPNHAAYCATKFAVHGLTENIREEVAMDDVRVITISPGAVETNLLSHTTNDEIKAGYSDWKDEMGGVIAPKTIADAALFAYEQPQSVCVREMVIAATRQQP
ncbi:SDR family oxidoreductase [Shewanella surugensis]|uniref:SDR family oxidoreductase n=1 Tax=Shewanella surugensis TaxID=212020 RepID=A0ABT0LAX0_9GAMM|nr:SDR family oxidoreductase [Shewanella surugensis]MCL1124848.1 SDR family oxidoreductase [Shewanella surugensis]